MTLCHNTQKYTIFACLLTAQFNEISVSAKKDYGENN